MGGSITVESVVNQGTEVTVYINFPLAPRPEEQTDALPQSEKVRSLCGKRVLLCEDQALNAKITQKLLESRECETVWAENGQLGLQRILSSPEGYFNAVLMDIRMPVMDGIAAAKAIRALPRRDATRMPIIALSANAYDADIQHAREAGMNAHLAKPFKPEALFELLTAQIALSEEECSHETGSISPRRD